MWILTLHYQVVCMYLLLWIKNETKTFLDANLRLQTPPWNTRTTWLLYKAVGFRQQRVIHPTSAWNVASGNPLNETWEYPTLSSTQVVKGFWSPVYIYIYIHIHIVRAILDKRTTRSLGTHLPRLHVCKLVWQTDCMHDYVTQRCHYCRCHYQVVDIYFRTQDLSSMQNFSFAKCHPFLRFYSVVWNKTKYEPYQFISIRNRTSTLGNWWRHHRRHDSFATYIRVYWQPWQPWFNSVLRNRTKSPVLNPLHTSTFIIHHLHLGIQLPSSKKYLTSINVFCQLFSSDN